MTNQPSRFSYNDQRMKLVFFIIVIEASIYMMSITKQREIVGLLPICLIVAWKTPSILSVVNPAHDVY